MANDLTTGQTVSDFQEKVAERIRASIGDLMPDEVLKGIVERALEEGLFKPRTVVTGTDRWGAAQTKTEPPFLPGFVADLVKERLDLAIREHLASRQDEIDLIVRDVLGQGVASAMASAIEGLFARPMDQLRSSVFQVMTELAVLRR